ncbi:MAG: ribosome maturation factor RimP [Acidimicrobiales bacterium]|nr:ribosome maturation factor RimP [Actinomycetes bacterium]MDP6105720.1 ribosome maturation factor RimP [Acidimicrobiales bacterium]MCP4845873.1 ribosome maturation factor RimP [Actinomycetes bacterium]MDP6241635.1 ribosome maturation factor RimP [Acidimicrobiales bacterium]MDP6492544.1 ribosome maturation factor RimP [Acidimicrobiales bacterium]
MTDRVGSLVAPLCDRVGVELLDIDYDGGVVRVTVDHPDGVGMDAIAALTREVSRALDHEDPVKGRYTLEVSSPGLERTLRRPGHFVRAIGSTVTVKTLPGTDGDRRVQGILESADEGGITLRTAEDVVRVLRHDEIQKARTVFEWTSAPESARTSQGRHAIDESEVGR